MSESVDSWPDERVQAEPEVVLADLRTLEEYLAEPLTLADAIAELSRRLTISCNSVVA